MSLVIQPLQASALPRELKEPVKAVVLGRRACAGCRSSWVTRASEGYIQEPLQATAIYACLLCKRGTHAELLQVCLLKHGGMGEGRAGERAGGRGAFVIGRQKQKVCNR